MAGHLFQDVVAPSIKVGSQKAYSVPLSISVHTAIIAVLVIAPLVVPGGLPAPPTVLAFIAGPSSSPPPPPPPAPSRAPDVQAQAAASNLAAAPLDAPSAIAPEPRVSPARELVGVIENGAGIVPASMVEGAVLPPAPAAPVASAPVRPGGNIRPPAKVKDVRPTYPAIAQAAKVEGLVIIEATIGPDGKVQDARVLRSNPLLDAAALDAVRQWEFTPTLLNGKPVPVIMTVTVDFKLR